MRAEAQLIGAHQQHAPFDRAKFVPLPVQRGLEIRLQGFEVARDLARERGEIFHVDFEKFAFGHKLAQDFIRILAGELPLIKRLHRAAACAHSTVVAAGSAHLDLTQHGNHFNRGQRRIGTLVTGLGAGTFDRLFYRIDRENTENHWHAAIRGHGGKTARAGASHVIEMRCCAADNRTERDHRIALAAQRELARDDRQFERTGHFNDRDITLRDTVATQNIHTARFELVDNEVVKAAANHRDLDRIGHDQCAFDDFVTTHR